jgi:hypothetical protein
MKAQRSPKSLSGATFYADVPTLDERALEHPYAMKVMEFVAKKSRSLHYPSMHQIVLHLGSQCKVGVNAIDPRSASVALMFAGFVTAEEKHKANGSEYASIKLTAKGWQAIGQTPPLWM